MLGTYRPLLVICKSCLQAVDRVHAFDIADVAHYPWQFLHLFDFHREAHGGQGIFGDGVHADYIELVAGKGFGNIAQQAIAVARSDFDVDGEDLP